jgi:ABC-type transporter Mla subunit MlaD
MASLKDVEQLADDLEELVGRLRSELRNGPDFEKLVQIADDLSEHADNAATTFSTVNDALMSRLNEVKGSSRETRRASSGASTKQKVS